MPSLKTNSKVDTILKQNAEVFYTQFYKALSDGKTYNQEEFQLESVNDTKLMSGLSRHEQDCHLSVENICQLATDARHQVHIIPEYCNELLRLMREHGIDVSSILAFIYK